MCFYLKVTEYCIFFRYKQKSFKLLHFLGCGLLYITVDQSKYEMRCGFAYGGFSEGLVEERVLPHVGDVKVFGGLPAVHICVKIESKWTEKVVSYEKFKSDCRIIKYCDREARKIIYEQLRAGEPLKYWKNEFPSKMEY